MGGGEREARDVDVGGIFDYGCFEVLDKHDGVADEESECTILVLAILVAIFCKEMYAHFDLLL